MSYQVFEVDEKPAWLRRIEKKIADNRAHLSRLTQWHKSDKSKGVKYKLRGTAKHMKIDLANESEVASAIEQLKMKVQSLVAHLRNYKVNIREHEATFFQDKSKILFRKEHPQCCSVKNTRDKNILEEYE